MKYRCGVKIKDPSAKNRKRAALREKYFHWWLAPEKVKKVGRLGQLNKRNRSMRVVSEFIRAALSIEEDPTGRTYAV